MVSQNRVVSFPEAATNKHPMFSLEQTTRRVVSLPERSIRSRVHFEQEHSISSSSGSTEDTRGRQFDHSSMETPSPPSSPESVLIIGTDNASAASRGLEFGNDMTQHDFQQG